MDKHLLERLTNKYSKREILKVLNEAIDEEKFRRGGYDYNKIILTKDFNFMPKELFKERTKIRGAYNAHKKILKKFEKLNWINPQGDIIIPKGTIMTCYDESIDAFGTRDLRVYDFHIDDADIYFFLYPAHHDTDKFFKSVKLYK